MTARVAITGIGAVTPLGVGMKAALDAVERGDRAGRGPLSLFDASGFGQPSGAEVIGFNAREHFPSPKAVKLTDRPAQFAVAAAAMALADSGWGDGGRSRDDLGVVVGCSNSDVRAGDLGQAVAGIPPARAGDAAAVGAALMAGLNPLWLLQSLPNMASAHVAIQLGARGPNSTTVGDWAAGASAIGEAFAWIRNREASAVLAGGADSGLHPYAYAAFAQAGLFDSEEPYLPGEGAAVFMLEDAAPARARNARTWGEVCGYASTAAAPGEEAATVEAVSNAFRAAMTEAGWTPQDVAAIVTCSPRWRPGRRPIEAVMQHIFGRAHAAVELIDLEPQLGHALAAAAPTALAIALASRRWSARRGLLCCATGLTGAAVALAVRAGNPEDGRMSLGF